MLRQLRVAIAFVLLASAGCSLQPFQNERPSAPPGQPPVGGSGPVLTVPPAPTPDTDTPVEQVIEPAPPVIPVPRERPKVAPAVLSPASKSLVTQAQAQRKKGDLPGAGTSLDRALRIEPHNPLLWIEMGRLRMDQRNFSQAEAMGRKALSMSVGDGRTQSSAWQLIADALRARGKNPEAEDAIQKSKELAFR